MYNYNLEPESYFTLNKYLQDEMPSFDKKTNFFIIHICCSILKTDRGLSKIDPNTELGKEILEYTGYTGTRTRHFYNNICNSDELKDIKYLEIGTWYGSSSISAVYKNNITGLFIDNWSQFEGEPKIFKDSISKFKGDSKVHIVENDCWKVDLKKLNMGPFNVYLYDGGHSELDHFKSLEYYYPVLDDTFIFMVDDWNWPNVRDGTMRAINTLNLKVLFRHEEFISSNDLVNMPNHKGKNTWWNGIGIFLLSKTSGNFK